MLTGTIQSVLPGEGATVWRAVESDLLIVQVLSLIIYEFSDQFDHPLVLLIAYSFGVIQEQIEIRIITLAL